MNASRMRALGDHEKVRSPVGGCLRRRRCSSPRRPISREFNRAFCSGQSDPAESRWINDGHHLIHDFATFAENLVAAGFEHLARHSIKAADGPRLLIDRADRAFESLYVEADKPRPDARSRTGSPISP